MKRFIMILVALILFPGLANADWASTHIPELVTEGYFDLIANPQSGASQFSSTSIGYPTGTAYTAGSYVLIQVVSGGSVFWNTTGASGVTSGPTPIGNNTYLNGWIELISATEWQNFRIIAGAIATRCYYKLYSLYPFK